MQNRFRKMLVRRIGGATVALLISVWPALAHMTVMPRQSTAGIGEKYTVRVPTEGAKVTISAELRVPEGVHVYNVQAPINWTQDITRENGLITDVVWNVNIQSGEFMEFSFIALNPADAAQIVWTLRQNYSDGSSDDWTNGPDGPYSGAVTRLMPLPNQ